MRRPDSDLQCVRERKEREGPSLKAEKNELPLMRITTMEQLNERVEEAMAMRNGRFGIDPLETENGFVPLEMSREELDRILTRRLKRKADKGSCFSIREKKVQLIKDDGNILVVEPKTIVEIRITWTGEIFGYYNHEYYHIKEIDPKAAFVSSVSEQSLEGTAPTSKKQNKPSLDHPWRHMKI